MEFFKDFFEEEYLFWVRRMEFGIGVYFLLEVDMIFIFW